MTDSEITKVIRRMLAAESKPKTFSPIDLLQAIRLLVQRSDERDTYLSQDTLAAQLCASPDAIQRSQQRLHKSGWIVVRKGGYRGRTNLYAVQIDKLPIGDLSKTIISEEGQRLATKYSIEVRKTGRKLKKGHQQQWSFLIEKLRKRCQGNIALLEGVVNFALTTPEFRQKALRGPAELRKNWGNLVTAFNAAVEAQNTRAKATHRG